jgi:arsenate reductase
MIEVQKVLFICTGNSVRSQMAEGLMNALGQQRWKARSAGMLSSDVHPLAIQVMKEIGIDISHHTSKSLDLFLNETFDFIITLCDHAALSCPNFPGQGKRIH